MDRERIPKLQSSGARGRSRDDVLRCIASFFGKLHPKANFEEEEEDESRCNHPCGNKYQRRPAGFQIEKQLTDCVHDELAVWQYSVNSMAHLRGSKRQSCSAGNCGSKQPEKCTQEFLALDHRSVNSTPKSDCNRNRCHCSVQLLINERFRRLQQATGGPDLERGFYCCSLNKYLRFPERTELPRAATLQSYLAAHCVEEEPRARRGRLLEAVLRLTSKRDRLMPL